MSPRTWATCAEPQEGQLSRVVVSRINAAPRRWPTSSRMLAGIATPSRRAAPPSGRLILPRPEQYGQRRLSTSPDTASTAAAEASAQAHTENASAEVYERRTPSDSTRPGTVCRTTLRPSADRAARAAAGARCQCRVLHCRWLGMRERSAAGGSLSVAGASLRARLETGPAGGRRRAQQKNPAPLRGRDLHHRSLTTQQSVDQWS